MGEQGAPLVRMSKYIHSNYNHSNGIYKSFLYQAAPTLLNMRFCQLVVKDLAFKQCTAPFLGSERSRKRKGKGGKPEMNKKNTESTSCELDINRSNFVIHNLICIMEF